MCIRDSSALKTASCARSRRMGYNYMQIGQLVVPDIFAVLVNFTLAAQQIAKITTLYTSPSVARLPRLLPLLIRAPVIARQVPALSVHVLDPSSVEKVEREESLSICRKREREREREGSNRAYSEGIGGRGGEGRSKPISQCSPVGGKFAR